MNTLENASISYMEDDNSVKYVNNIELQYDDFKVQFDNGKNILIFPFHRVLKIKMKTNTEEHGGIEDERKDRF